MGRRQLLMLPRFLYLSMLLMLAASPAGPGGIDIGSGSTTECWRFSGRASVCCQTKHFCSSNGCCRSDPMNFFRRHQTL